MLLETKSVRNFKTSTRKVSVLVPAENYVLVHGYPYFYLKSILSDFSTSSFFKKLLQSPQTINSLDLCSYKTPAQDLSYVFAQETAEFKV